MSLDSRVLAFVELEKVFSLSTDLCQTLGDTYKGLAGLPVMLILWSSKTRLELQQLQQQIAITHPFVCENGAAVLIPHSCNHPGLPPARPRSVMYDIVEFGRRYSEVVVALDKAAKRASVDIAGFNDMSIEDVARECHLPLLRAQLAKMREYEEPFRFVVEDASARIRLLKALRAARLRCTTVGRYDHVGASVDARSAVELLSRVLRRACERPMTVGFSTDHHGVLRAVDIPILVTARPADIVGRAGWITQILRDIACTRRASASGAPSA